MSKLVLVRVKVLSVLATVVTAWTVITKGLEMVRVTKVNSLIVRVEVLVRERVARLVKVRVVLVLMVAMKEVEVRVVVKRKSTNVYRLRVMVSVTVTKRLLVKVL